MVHTICSLQINLTFSSKAARLKFKNKLNNSTPQRHQPYTLGFLALCVRIASHGKLWNNHSLHFVAFLALQPFLLISESLGLYKHASEVREGQVLNELGLRIPRSPGLGRRRRAIVGPEYGEVYLLTHHDYCRLCSSFKEKQED